MPKLYVIAGHGAGDPGAGGGGMNEADLVRKLAAKMKELGGSDVDVLDTSRNWYKDGGVNASLKSKVGSVPVLELHLDSASASANAMGGHVIIKSGFSADKYDNALAAFLKKEFPGRSDVIVKRDNLANVNRAAAHGINYRLVEVCFITSDADRNKLVNDMAGVATGLLAAFGITAKASAKSGKWVHDKKGWWYRYEDGTWPKSEWLQLKGIWYWFGADGYAAQSECLQIKGKWYAFDNDCHMLTSVKVNKGGDLAL